MSRYLWTPFSTSSIEHAGPSGIPAQSRAASSEYIDTGSDAIFAASLNLWQDRDIPVCWENPGDDDAERGLAVHEFGHALGFAHEHNRFDTPSSCMEERQGADGDLVIGSRRRSLIAGAVRVRVHLGIEARCRPEPLARTGHPLVAIRDDMAFADLLVHRGIVPAVGAVDGRGRRFDRARDVCAYALDVPANRRILVPGAHAPGEGSADRQRAAPAVAIGAAALRRIQHAVPVELDVREREELARAAPPGPRSFDPGPSHHDARGPTLSLCRATLPPAAIRLDLPTRCQKSKGDTRSCKIIHATQTTIAGNVTLARS
ncbi:M12 family metallopeptidase [Sorangium sp. So ce1151]|uniref:M12 family metallopeptidase n=1 Tax=Sorangium sp. So ce1151 TaxID=3133332 RepID=UPI003F60E8AA